MAPPCWVPSWLYCGFEPSHASNASQLQLWFLYCVRWLWKYVAAPYDDKHLRCIVFFYRIVSVIFLLYVCRSANHFRFYVYVEGIPVTFMTTLRTVLPNEVVLSL